MAALTRRSLFALPVAAPLAAVTGKSAKAKPIAIGWIFNVQPTEVDRRLLVFAVNDGPVSEIFAVQDGGVELLMDRNYATVEELSGAAIPPGHFATCFAAGSFRLCMPAVFRLIARVDAGGDQLGRGFFPAEPYENHELAGAALAVRAGMAWEG